MFLDAETRHLILDSRHPLLERRHTPPAFRTRSIDRSRNGEVEILTQTIEPGVHFGEARASLEDQVVAIRVKFVQQKRAEVVLFDQARDEVGFGCRKADSLQEQRPVFVQPERRSLGFSHCG